MEGNAPRGSRTTLIHHNAWMVVYPWLRFLASILLSIALLSVILPSMTTLRLSKRITETPARRSSVGTPESDVWYRIRPQGEINHCISIAFNIVDPRNYPIRLGSCEMGDYALWQFIPDNNNRYFIYNKAVGINGQRLDFVQPDMYPDILIMGPSDDKYNNQRWMLSRQSDNSVQIGNFGYPNGLLSYISNGTVLGVILTGASSDHSLWDLSADGDTEAGATSSVVIATIPRASTSTAQKAVTSSIQELVIPTKESLQSVPIVSSGAQSTDPSTSFWGTSSTSLAVDTTTSSATQSAMPEKPGSHLSVGAFVGIALGSAVAVGLIIFLFFYYRKLKARQKKRLTLSNQAPKSENMGNLSEIDAEFPL